MGCSILVRLYDSDSSDLIALLERADVPQQELGHWTNAVAADMQVEHKIILVMSEVTSF